MKNYTEEEKPKGKRKLDIKMGNSSEELERRRKREYSRGSSWACPHPTVLDPRDKRPCSLLPRF